MAPLPPSTPPVGVCAEELIEQHLWLADLLAGRFANRGEAVEDLVQVARLGLVEAASRFDPARGGFSAFASSTMSGVLKRHFRDHCWAVRPPRHIQELSLRIRQQWPTLSQQHRSVPDAHQLAAALDETPEAIHEAMAANENYRMNHLDSLADVEGPAGAEDGSPLDRVEARLAVRALLRSLGDDDRALLRMRFVEERSQSDIAATLGTSQMQVSRLLRRLLDDLLDRSEGVVGVAA